MPETNVVVVGAGAAGLSLAHRLAESVSGLRAPSVILVDAPPGPLRPPPRTWCYWTAEPGRFDAAVRAEWRRLRVRPRTGAPVEGNIAPLRYRMIRSDDFERVVSRDLARSPTVRRLEATVEAVEDVPGGAHVRMRDAHGRTRVLSARWVFDSRPPGSLPAARTTLLQHFHGWFVRTARPVFDPAAVELMDFRTPSPPTACPSATSCPPVPARPSSNTPSSPRTPSPRTVTRRPSATTPKTSCGSANARCRPARPASSR